MNDPVRPDPDELLAAIQRDEAANKRGRLKVFLGMCPGVGKTYAMLETARRELANGRDVVIGLVETHGRKETAALVAGIPEIPRMTAEYRGMQLKEFDLDAALARKPSVLLVDELAHTNVPGVRHQKRFHDVLELLGVQPGQERVALEQLRGRHPAMIRAGRRRCYLPAAMQLCSVVALAALTAGRTARG